MDSVIHLNANIEEDKEEVEVHKELFHDGEKLFQKLAHRAAFAQKVAERQIHDSVPSSVRPFLENRHAIYVSAQDPKTGDVWCSVIYARPNPDIPKESSASSEGLIEQCLRTYYPPAPPERVNGNGAKSEGQHNPDIVFIPSDPFSVASAVASLVTPYQASSYHKLVEVSDEGTHVKILQPLQLHDPLWDALSKTGTEVSIGYYELETRTRYRTSGVVSVPVSEGNGFEIKVNEAFSICPKYIQARIVIAIHDHPPQEDVRCSWMEEEYKDGHLPGHMVNLISQSDTFFIATVAPHHGADSSHRGGRPGFVRVIDNQILCWGDYPGMEKYQTLGNTVYNPSVGLLFVDFDNGHTIQVSGKFELIWTEKNKALDSADRMAMLTVNKWIYRKYSCPFRWKLLQRSAYVPILEDNPVLEQVAKGRKIISKAKDASLTGVWDAEVDQVRQETKDVKTFRFRVAGEISYQPGQEAVFELEVDGHKFIRAWTISSAHLMLNPHMSHNIRQEWAADKTNFFEMSVKRDPTGSTSGWLHEKVQHGTHIKLLGVEGDFTLDKVGGIMMQNRKSEDEPSRNWFKVCLFSGGIGCTPMISMLRGFYHTLKAKFLQPSQMPDIVWIHSDREIEAIPFQQDMKCFTKPIKETLESLQEGMDANEVQHMEHPLVKLFFALSKEEKSEDDCNKVLKEEIGVSAVKMGHLDTDKIKELVPDIRQRVCMLCGPPPFMDAVEHGLKTLGVNELHILTESFLYST